MDQTKILKLYNQTFLMYLTFPLGRGATG